MGIAKRGGGASTKLICLGLLDEELESIFSPDDDIYREADFWPFCWGGDH